MNNSKDELVFMGEHTTNDMVLHCDLMFWADDENLSFQSSINCFGQYVIKLTGV
tara:strand:- start:285 stop:446 length:162 start_codon:yes stop_codon:yes gene_type:complete